MPSVMVKNFLISFDTKKTPYIQTDLLIIGSGVAGLGADEYLRLSYATSMENISKGLQRIERLVTKIL